MSSIRLTVILGWAALCACSNGDCTNPAPDMDANHLARWVQAELSPPGDIQDLTTGDGRLAQNDRRMELSVTVSDGPGGKVLAEGQMRVEWPRWQAKGEYVVRMPSRSADRFFAAVAGMRVGGERQFSLTFRREYPDECQGSRGHCNFRLGAQEVEVPYGGSLSFNVKLQSVCAPRYCEQTTYSIPLDKSSRLIEKSCR